MFAHAAPCEHPAADLDTIVSLQDGFNVRVSPPPLYANGVLSQHHKVRILQLSLWFAQDVEGGHANSMCEQQCACGSFVTDRLSPLI